jgi:hypothetical protein
MLLLIVIIRVVCHLERRHPESHEPSGLLRGQRDESWHIKMRDKQRLLGVNSAATAMVSITIAYLHKYGQQYYRRAYL